MNVLIIGGGKVGRHLAKQLSARHTITVIEQRADRISIIEQEAGAVAVIHGNGTEPLLMETAGIRKMDVVAAVTGLDETNLVATSLARFEFHVARTIARINDPRNAWMFTKEMGVDVALNQADLMAHLIVEEISLGDMMTLLKLSKGQFSLVEERIATAARVVGKSIGELKLPGECALAAVIRQGELLIPKADLILQPDDEVLAVVHTEHEAELATLLG